MIKIAFWKAFFYVWGILNLVSKKRVRKKNKNSRLNPIAKIT